MAADDLIKLEFSFVSGGADRVAGLFWVNENGDEQKYADVHERGMLTQETFAGHRWVLKGARTNDVLLEVVAAAEPPVQSFRIDIDGEEAELVRPGRRRGERAPAGGEGAGDEPRGDDATTAGSASSLPEEAGRWVGASGLHVFERVPPRGSSARVRWRELDVDGNEVAVLNQLEARVDTRWLWWAGSAYTRVASMSHEKEYLVMSALSIAGAYHLDLRIPHWLTVATGGHLGPNPLMLVLVVLTLLGAAIAAAVPLVETTVILYNPANRTEIRLGGTHGLSREISHDARRPARWVPVCDGAFAMVPPELRELQSKRSHHMAFLAFVGALTARACYRSM